MNRREFLQLASVSALSGVSILSGCASVVDRTGISSTSAEQGVDAAQFSLRITPVKLELAPKQIVQTIGYNGSAPGPLLRVKEGQRVIVNVRNDSDVAELVHWHGLYVPSEVDGAMEEGTPMVPAGGSRQYAFTAQPGGTRWYHTHAFAGKDLTRSLYSGQFGFFYIEPKNDPGNYDREVFLAAHHWNPMFVSMQDIRKGPPPDNGMEVMYHAASFNDKSLGYGEPIRVKTGARVLFHVLNASATDDVRLTLPGHDFNVIALDGNPVPNPRAVPVLVLAPAERIDAIVEMKQPGVWIFGAIEDGMREMGMGVVVEYAGQRGAPQWSKPQSSNWDYTIFGTNTPRPEPDHRFNLVFEKIPGGHGGFNRWTINGKSWPDVDPLLVESGRRYRITVENRSGDDHPVHFHRHTFELTRIGGKTTSGILKDTVNIPRRQSAEIDLVADDPGLTLYHCHMQLHMDFGFMALMKYA
ncbi:MAG TPA: multicopper oxidase domain-containing protein [Methylomirabilota bacterium]|nr:multicopper oxidase domain-containing protein [Methylomirabilota bacterium]